MAIEASVINTSVPRKYLLTNDEAELERLRLQARVWEPETETMLDRIGIQPGWRCLDLGCGGMGILGPLSQRVGRGGQVVGVDCDPNVPWSKGTRSVSAITSDTRSSGTRSSSAIACASEVRMFWPISVFPV